MTTPPKKSFGLRLNLGLMSIAQNWLRIALVIVGIYAALPWVAPTLMKLGLTAPASVLYTLYSPMCHQFAFRSIFLFGEQPFYPRAAAGTPYQPFEPYALVDDTYQEQFGYWHNYWLNRPLDRALTSEDLNDFSVWMQFAARDFRGNEQMGYKTTLCARDVAIYSALFLGGCLYAMPKVRRRLRPMPILLYVFVALGPIGLDGFSQLLSYPPFNFWEIRETAPFFRIATGAIFGLMNVWLAFPYMEMSMRDTYRQIEAKLIEKFGSVEAARQVLKG
jgi:uncharacterized membrane protein